MNTKMNEYKKVFVISPHTDDGELGAGGFLSNLIKQKSQIYYIAFSTAEASVSKDLPKDILKTEVKDACLELGIEEENIILYNYEVRKLNYHRQEILEELIKLRQLHEPDLVLVPSRDDIHQDHSTVAQESLRAFKNTTILGYELIWNNLKFNNNACVKLDKNDVESKVNALSKYRSQKGKNYMEREFIFSLARTRGVQIGTDYAEAFEVLRWIMD